MLIEFLNPDLNNNLVPFNASKIYHAIKNSAILNFGDAGWGAIGVSLSGEFLYNDKSCTDSVVYSEVLLVDHESMYRSCRAGPPCNGQSRCHPINHN